MLQFKINYWDFLSEWRTLLQPIVVDFEEDLVDEAVVGTGEVVVGGAVGGVVAEAGAVAAARRTRNGSLSRSWAAW